MEFEFQESEVIFGDLDGRMPDKDDAGHDHRNSRSNETKKRIATLGNSLPPPVNIPRNIWQIRDFEEYLDDDEGEKVPPHVIVDRRRIDGKVACSVCFGHGRTLKGRYLSEVRNSVLRMTGFLES